MSAVELSTAELLLILDSSLCCQQTHKCVIKDDAPAIVEKMKNADVIAFASPIYYYEMSGQLKTLLDRANPLFGSDYAFRDIYFISAAADTDEDTDKRAVSGLEGWIACFERARLAGKIFGAGANDVGDIAGNPAVQEAYRMGRNI
ncbi:MAG: NAD(P)H-dependent oxidoreductase [Eubacteriales bacterium]|nr:NAD(P)H-dependent oxidoreductase [Eubacteriales bacterium]MDD3883149.1 NAD(P)H-dependent oxidoreductase [Eubacteriales bacterium]MDD4512681.1 NAD(P)H-dependent oxidoreductase [Eubacteriales bacterium]